MLCQIGWFLLFAIPPGKEKFRKLLTIREPKNTFEKLFTLFNYRNVERDEDVGKIAEEASYLAIIIFLIMSITHFIIIFHSPLSSTLAGNSDKSISYIIINLYAAVIMMIIHDYVVYLILKVYDKIYERIMRKKKSKGQPPQSVFPRRKR